MAVLELKSRAVEQVVKDAAWFYPQVRVGSLEEELEHERGELIGS